MNSFIKWCCYYNEIENVFIKLQKINYVVVKGDALSIQAYNAPGKRHYSDIDILIPLNHLTSIEKILLADGFLCPKKSRSDRVTMISASHQVAPWRKSIYPWGKVEIDLNFDIFWGEYTGKRIDINTFVSDSVDIEIFGCKIKTLRPLKAMVQLILHHYKDMNSIYHLSSHNCIRLNMFEDVYYLWKNNQSDISLDNLMNISINYGIIPYVYYILYFTNRIFNDVDLGKYVKEFKTSDGEALLNYYGLTEREKKEWKIGFETRLENNDLYSLIKNDLAEADIEKLHNNQRIFR